MNQRIQELAVQAGIKITPMVVDGVEYEYEDVEMDGSEDLQKFAELIIAECCVALRPMLRDMISRSRGVDLIVEHFRDKE